MDQSAAIRRTVQFGFLALNVYLGVVFYFFVRTYEKGGVPSFERPAGVEGWLPIAGLMNLKYFLMTGMVPAVHPAAMFLLAAFLTMSVVFRKAFCGWLCPVGTVSEYLWKAGRSMFRRNFAAPKWLDIPLRALKYILLGLFGWVILKMSPENLRQFLESPYGIVADVKMLNFFRFMGTTAAVVIGLLLIGSIFVQNLWCRYLCPYGALTGLASLVSPLRIRREAETCIDCAKCAKACPSHLPVDKLLQIRSAECLGCMECVAACPVEATLYMAAPLKRRVEARHMAAGALTIFFAFVLVAKLGGWWQTDVATRVYQDLIPRVQEFEHP